VKKLNLQTLLGFMAILLWSSSIAFLRSVQEKNGGCVFGGDWRYSLQVFDTAEQHSGKRYTHE